MRTETQHSAGVWLIAIVNFVFSPVCRVSAPLAVLLLAACSVDDEAAKKDAGADPGSTIVPGSCTASGRVVVGKDSTKGWRSKGSARGWWQWRCRQQAAWACAGAKVCVSRARVRDRHHEDCWACNGLPRLCCAVLCGHGIDGCMAPAVCVELHWAGGYGRP